MDKLALAALATGFITAGIGATVWIAEWWTAREVLRRRVWSNLDDAYMHGQFDHDGHCKSMLPGELAYDLTCYASDLEDSDPDKLLPHVRAWMQQKGLA